MSETLHKWLFDPTVGRFVAAVIGILVVVAIVRILSRSLGGHIQDNDTRYRVRKLIAFGGYLAGLLLITVVFSNRLSGPAPATPNTTVVPPIHVSLEHLVAPAPSPSAAA